MICASSSTIWILCAQAPEIVVGVSGNFLHCGQVRARQHTQP